jgi:hypothetical protein
MAGVVALGWVLSSLLMETRFALAAPSRHQLSAPLLAAGRTTQQLLFELARVPPNHLTPGIASPPTDPKSCCLLAKTSRLTATSSNTAMAIACAKTSLLSDQAPPLKGFPRSQRADKDKTQLLCEVTRPHGCTAGHGQRDHHAAEPLKLLLPSPVLISPAAGADGNSPLA